MISVVMLWIQAKSYVDPHYIAHTVGGFVDHTTEDLDFVCVTNTVKSPQTQTHAGQAVRMVPLTRNYAKHQHAKLEMFRPDLELAERAVTTDLDNFVVGDLSDLLAYDGPFAARSTFMPISRPQPQMSFAVFQPKALEPVWARAKQMDQRQLVNFAPVGQGRGDQLFIYKVLGEFDRFDKLLPGQLDSWKWHRIAGRSPDARVLFAHGRPKPHDLGWAHDGQLSRDAQQMVNKARQRILRQVQAEEEEFAR